MNPTLERLQQEHRRLNRIIDSRRSDLRQDQMTALKRARLQMKDRIARLQRSAGQPAL